MDIGTAKPDAATLLNAPHALIDLVEPWESYSVAQFLTDADAEIKRIHSNGNIPVLAGGTMLYFRTFWDGLSDLPATDPVVRQSLEGFVNQNGLQALHDRLRKVDSVTADRLHSADPQRILRAMEVFEMTGAPLSQLQNQRTRDHQYNCYNIGLFPKDRPHLHARIAQRFNLMIEAGFESEVEALIQHPKINSELPAMRCVGYRQMCQYLRGDFDRAEMTERATAATRQLAKRQITWLRSMSNCRMIDPFVETIEQQDPHLHSWVDRGLATLSSKNT